MKKMNLLEAALYAAGRPLDLAELGRVIHEKEPDRIRGIMEQLISAYKQRETALEVVALPNDRYVLQLKPSLSPKVSRYAPTGFLSGGALKVLSLVGLKQPIMQSEVIEQRGPHAYTYIKELLDKNFISKIPHKRTFILKTTETFASYFGFPSDITHLKLQLQRLLQKQGYLRAPGETKKQVKQTTLEES
ncbi:MAG: SMC-Scp complex subunit ScpB [Candidatus Ranarchaeia archaeon]